MRYYIWKQFSRLAPSVHEAVGRPHVEPRRHLCLLGAGGQPPQHGDVADPSQVEDANVHIATGIGESMVGGGQRGTLNGPANRK